MTYELSLIDRIPRTYTITAVDENDNPVTLTSIGIAAVPPRAAVDDQTQWTPHPVTDGTFTVVYAAPQATATGAIVIPVDGADIHRRWVDGGYVDTELIERITVR